MGEELVLVEEFGMTRAFGALAESGQQLQVLAHLWRRPREVAVDESAADEHFACDLRIDAAVVAAPGGHDDESVKRDLFGRPHESGPLVPLGRMIAVLADRTGDRFEPTDVDDCGVAREETRGVDKLARHEPGAVEVLLGRFCQNRARMNREAEAVGAAVVAFFLVVFADASEQPRQKRHVQSGGEVGVRGLIPDS